MDPAALMAMMNNNYGFGGLRSSVDLDYPPVLRLVDLVVMDSVEALTMPVDLLLNLNTDANTNLLMQAINGNKEAISSLSNTLNCDF